MLYVFFRKHFSYSINSFFNIKENNDSSNKIITRKIILAGILIGIFTYGGETFQQMGAVYTTAGNTGFIT